MTALPRGTCLVCRKSVALRTTRTLREHRNDGTGRVCRGSAYRPLEALEAAPETVTESEEERRQEGGGGGVCRSCGCTESRACIHPELGPCGWVEPDLCSACVPGADPAWQHPTTTRRTDGR